MAIFRGPIALQVDTIPVFVPYDGPQIVEVFSSICGIIDKVDADLVVVNSLMTAGLTACYHLGVKFTCLSPNSIKDFAASTQPKAAGLWKIPALFSGFQYPVPWYSRPSNIYFNLYALFAWGRDQNRKKTEKYLAAQTGAILRTPMDLTLDRPDGVRILVSSLPELDFPLIIPDYVIPCGPILRDASTITESDPALEDWLSRGPTIYLNLGSICPVTEDQAVELASALKIVLDTLRLQPKAQSFQVLWKLKRLGDYEVSGPGCPIGKALGHSNRDLVEIVDWIQVEPIAILQSGHAACSIHHGGANSFNEAVKAGVPQVVLPQWIDCYDYAERVEMLGIGRVGNRIAKPKWSAGELSQQLLHVLHGENAVEIRRNARELAHLCDKNGVGAMVAAQMLLGECPEKTI